MDGASTHAPVLTDLQYSVVADLQRCCHLASASPNIPFTPRSRKTSRRVACGKGSGSDKHDWMTSPPARTKGE